MWQRTRLVAAAGVRKNKQRASPVIGLIETRFSFGGISKKAGGSLGDTVRRAALLSDRFLPHS